MFILTLKIDSWMLLWLRIGLTIEKTQLLFVNLVFNLYSFFLFWHDSLSMAKNRNWINTSNHQLSQLYKHFFINFRPKTKITNYILNFFCHLFYNHFWLILTISFKKKSDKLPFTTHKLSPICLQYSLHFFYQNIIIQWASMRVFMTKK